MSSEGIAVGDRLGRLLALGNQRGSVVGTLVHRVGNGGESADAVEQVVTQPGPAERLDLPVQPHQRREIPVVVESGTLPADLERGPQLGERHELRS